MMADFIYVDKENASSQVNLMSRPQFGTVNGGIGKFFLIQRSNPTFSERFIGLSEGKTSLDDQDKTENCFSVFVVKCTKISIFSGKKISDELCTFQVHFT